MKYMNATEAPIRIHGLLENYKRLPPNIINNISKDVSVLAHNAAGGRVRFATNAKEMEITVRLNGGGMMGHMPLTGMSGTDCYCDGVFIGTAFPGDMNVVEYKKTFRLDGQRHEIEFNLPLYNGVKEIIIGFNDDAVVEAPRKYKYEKPIVYYGSSITEGGCVSRPGNCYTSMVSRWVDADHINLGFSGSALGETLMAEYIASLEMSAFVLDYDHNAPTAEHLMATHKPFFDRIRRAHPTLPIVIMTKPDYDNGPEAGAQRRFTILKTYMEAMESGDKNVYFCDGKAMFTDAHRDSCTVDCCHPNDLGHYRMAKAVHRELPL